MDQSRELAVGFDMKQNFKRVISIIIQLIVIMILSVQGYAQEEPENLYLEMSLEELLDIEIVSASMRAETIFDSPLSASVISRAEIERSGATSIMEAMRLAPGLIVREQTNGRLR